jgi:hypothetical protein
MVQNFCGIYSSNTSVASIKILQEWLPRTSKICFRK